MALSQCTALMGDVPPPAGKVRPGARWGERGFRVPPRQPPPGIHYLTHSAYHTASVVHIIFLIHSYRQLWKRGDRWLFATFFKFQTIHRISLDCNFLPNIIDFK